jgi:hypothetical protein
LDGQEYAKYGEVEIYNKFREKLKMPLKSFAEHKGPFLFGQKPAIVSIIMELYKNLILNRLLNEFCYYISLLISTHPLVASVVKECVKI